MHSLLKEIENIGIVPVIKIEHVEHAEKLGRALIKGGIPCAEVTFRTEHAGQAIRRMSAALPELLVGAGTVLTVEQADSAVEAGAKFIVSPGLNTDVVSHCISRGMPIIPGCSTPSDIERAIGMGLEVVKFFPAEQSGGLDYIKAVAAPYGNVRFIPTGGISPTNLATYISFKRVLACGGSWMVAPELVNGERFDEITELCRQAVDIVHGFEMVHIGINCSENNDDAAETARWLSQMFGFKLKEGGSSIFASSSIEIMKTKGLGRHGHLAIGTNNIDRAMAYLSSKGVAFDVSNAKRDEAGNMLAVYLENEMAGFAVHLVKNNGRIKH